MSDMQWLVTCTKANVEHLSALTADQTRIELVYHGLDFTRFPSDGSNHSGRDGGDASNPVVIVSVGRAVEKKGYGDLLRALAGLPDGLAWKLIHIGGGELLRILKKQARDLGLSDRIEWLGAQPHETVLETYDRADVFVLASRIAANGDRDGLPNVLMEAQSQGVACISTHVSAIPELVIDGETGVLVAPGDTSALARELENLITDPALRRTFGEAGRQRVQSEFACEAGIDKLANRFGLVKEAEACESHSTLQ
jgi:glycosyltransferase involved in cell wall biosynthesis